MKYAALLIFCVAAGVELSVDGYKVLAVLWVCLLSLVAIQLGYLVGIVAKALA